MSVRACVKFLEGTRRLLQKHTALRRNRVTRYHATVSGPMAPGQKPGRAHLLPKCVLERESRQPIAHFYHTVQNAR